MQKETAKLFGSHVQIGDTRLAVSLAKAGEGYSVELRITQALPQGSVLHVADFEAQHPDIGAAKAQYDAVSDQLKWSRVTGEVLAREGRVA